MRCADQAGTSLPHARASINSSSPCDQDTGFCPWTDSADPPAGAALAVAQNPARTAVRIRYLLATNTRPTRIMVHDLHGRVVTRLLHEALPPRQGDVTWDGRDDTGAAVATGVYIVRLETPEATIAQKLVWLR